MAITAADANVRHNCHRYCKHNHECRENDDSGNSRTCFGAHRARRDDCRCDVGRDWAKKAAKMMMWSPGSMTTEIW